MKTVQKKRKQQYIKAYCLMYPWYIYEAHSMSGETNIWGIVSGD